MIKIFLLFINFLCLSDIKLVKSNITCDRNIIWSDGEYDLVDEGNIYICKGKMWQYNIGKVSNVNVEIQGKKIIILYEENGALSFLELDNDGKVQKNFIILRDEINNWSYKFYNNDLYIFGVIENYLDDYNSNKNLGKKDAILIKIDSTYNKTVKLFGGLLDEEFLDIMIYDNKIYYCVLKDSTTGGDFGYFGENEKSIIFGTLDLNFELGRYLTLNSNSNKAKISYYDDCLFLFLDNHIIKINNSLEVTNIKNIDSYDYIFIGVNGKVLFKRDKLCILDLNSYQSINIDEYINGIILENNDKLLFLSNEKKFFFDICDNKTSLFGPMVMINEKYTPLLDKSVYGTYTKNTSYITKGNINADFIETLTIPLEVNIQEGGIYPTNYKLQFTGKGYLNKQPIINNYSLSKEGKNTLELVSCDGKIKTFNFYVEKKQINFSELSSRISDIEVIKNSDYFLKINVKNIDIVNYIVMNDEKIENVKYQNEILLIPLNSGSEEGINKYHISEINYDFKSENYNLFVDLDYSVNTLSDCPIISITNQNDSKYLYNIDIDVEDYDNTLRYIEVIVYDNDIEKNYSFSIANQKIVLDELIKNKQYKACINFVYDVNSTSYLRQELFNFDFTSSSDEIEIGEIEVRQYTSSLEKMSISFKKEFSKNNLVKVNSDNKNIYTKIEFNFMKYIYIGIVIMVISFFSCFIFKKIMKKRGI